MSLDKQVFTVSELTHFIKYLLEQEPVLQRVQVSGEVSNLKYHGSGHVYFSVKDASAQLSCVLFRTYALNAPKMREGEKVILEGDITVYPPRGNYQMRVLTVQKAGVGDLFLRFMALKEKLEKEGLFSDANKQEIPVLPRTIAVLTSPTGAALRDILRTIRRRFDKVKVIIVPTVVQGEKGMPSIIKSLKLAQQTAAEVIILARGGGSIEDLWNFNEEEVARAIFACRIPVIAGIGHETDFTIADFVADLRASTPTAAAERSVPDKQGILNALQEYEGQLHRNLQHFVDFKRQVLDDYTFRMRQAFQQQVQQLKHELALLETRLKGLDSTDILRKGYTLTLKDGRILNSRKELQAGDPIDTVFQDGRVSSIIEEE